MSQPEKYPEVFPDHLAAIDHAVFRFLNDTMTHPLADVVLGFLTDFANFKLPLLIAGILILVFGGGKIRLTAITATVAVILADMIGADVKLALERMRPFWVLEDVRQILGPSRSRSYSFPSNHAVNTAAAGVIFAHAYWRKWWVVAACIVVPLLVGYSRVYVGVHFPLDVVAGYVIGVTVALGMLVINHREPVLSVVEGRLAIGWRGLALFMIVVGTMYRFSTAARAPYPLTATEAHGWYLTLMPLQWTSLQEFFQQLILIPWTALLGASELSFRALAVSMSLLGLIALWKVCNLWGFTERARAFVMLLVLLSPFQILAALFLSPASLSFGLVPVILLLGVLYIQKANIKTGWFYLAAIALEAALVGAGLLVAAVLFLARGMDRNRFPYLAASVLVGLGVLAIRMVIYLIFHLEGIRPFPSLPVGWLVFVFGLPLLGLVVLISRLGKLSDDHLLPVTWERLIGMCLVAFFIAVIFRVEWLAWFGVAWMFLALLAGWKIELYISSREYTPRHKATLGGVALVCVVLLGFGAATVHDRLVWRETRKLLPSAIQGYMDPGTSVMGSREVGARLKDYLDEYPEFAGVPIRVVGLPPAAPLYYAGIREAGMLGGDVTEGPVIQVLPLKLPGINEDHRVWEVPVFERRNVVYRTLYIIPPLESIGTGGSDTD